MPFSVGSISIASTTPDRHDAAGGTTFTLTGSFRDEPALVELVSAAGKRFSCYSGVVGFGRLPRPTPTTLSAVCPAVPPDLYDVVVTQTGHVATLTLAIFAYPEMRRLRVESLERTLPPLWVTHTRRPAPPRVQLTISPIADQQAAASVAFSFTPTIASNLENLRARWSLASGALPVGFTVNKTTGAVAGTAAAPQAPTVITIQAETVLGPVLVSFNLSVLSALLRPPDVASGAGFDPVRWYTAQSPDGNLPTLLVDGQNAPTTWHDFGSNAVDLPFNGVPAHVKWRAHGGPGGVQPSMEWVSQQPAGGPADMFAFAPGGVTTVPAMTMAFVFKRTDVNGVLRFLVGTGPGDSNRQVYVGEVGNAGVAAANHAPELRDDTLPASLPQTSYCWAIIEFNDASSRVKVGDGTTTHETLGTIGNGDHQMQGYFLGSFHAQQTQGDFSWVGFIQDFVVYEGVGASLRGQLTTYLNNKMAGA